MSLCAEAAVKLNIFLQYESPNQCVVKNRFVLGFLSLLLLQ